MGYPSGGSATPSNFSGDCSTATSVTCTGTVKLCKSSISCSGSPPVVTMSAKTGSLYGNAITAAGTPLSET